MPSTASKQPSGAASPPVTRTPWRCGTGPVAASATTGSVGGGGGGPLDTTRATLAESAGTLVPPAGSLRMTIPGASADSFSFTLVISNPCSCRMLEASCSDRPTTSGTVTRLGPTETAIVTVAPVGASVKAGGSCSATMPGSTSVASTCSAATPKPASWRIAAALASVSPTTSGTTLSGWAVDPRVVPVVWAPLSVVVSVARGPSPAVVSVVWGPPVGVAVVCWPSEVRMLSFALAWGHPADTAPAVAAATAAAAATHGQTGRGTRPGSGCQPVPVSTSTVMRSPRLTLRPDGDLRVTFTVTGPLATPMISSGESTSNDQPSSWRARSSRFTSTMPQFTTRKVSRTVPSASTLSLGRETARKQRSPSTHSTMSVSL